MKKEQPTKEDYQSDILDLQRKILKGVQIKNVKYLGSRLVMVDVML